MNGAAHPLVIDTRTTLLDALRERLGLTGLKKGCDHGQYGACAILLDGRRINSCLALAVAHQDAQIVYRRGACPAPAGGLCRWSHHQSEDGPFATPGRHDVGLSIALHEASVLDPRFGDYVNHDFAEYHIATNADVGEIDVTWIEEDDPHVNPIGVKGIGEIGIVGTAAIANAVSHATGMRVRDLPITLDKLLP